MKSSKKQGSRTLYNIGTSIVMEAKAVYPFLVHLVSTNKGVRCPRDGRRGVREIIITLGDEVK